MRFTIDFPMGQLKSKPVTEAAAVPVARPLGRVRQPCFRPTCRASIDSGEFADMEEVRLIRKIRGDLMRAIERQDVSTAHANLRLMNELYREMIAKKSGEQEQQTVPDAYPNSERPSSGEPPENDVPRVSGAGDSTDSSAAGGCRPAEPPEPAPAS